MRDGTNHQLSAETRDLMAEWAKDINTSITQAKNCDTNHRTSKEDIVADEEDFEVVEEYEISRGDCFVYS